MTRVLSILAVAGYLATNVGAAPVHDHLTPQIKTPTNPKVITSSNPTRSTQPSRAAVRKIRKPENKPYQVGLASWYGKQFHGRTTASGEDFDMFELTAAHKTLPLGTYVKVTNLRNGRWIIVRVNDRGPYVGHRIMDLSYSAARMLHFRSGVEKIRIDLIDQPAVASAASEGMGAN
ncbi:MAG TPA: septal ring lytic transglycosylase RlpA family protein [Candidatus Angelobacter sp.]|nr:septal ring lytic transglycosylase RlpA family protein [Candidatus Angelobacter sp.]